MTMYCHPFGSNILRGAFSIEPQLKIRMFKLFCDNAMLLSAILFITSERTSL